MHSSSKPGCSIRRNSIRQRKIFIPVVTLTVALAWTALLSGETGPPKYGPAAGALLEAYRAAGVRCTLSNAPPEKPN